MTRKIKMHQSIAYYLERTDPKRTGEMVRKLAIHFEQGREFLTASRYLC